MDVYEESVAAAAAMKVRLPEWNALLRYARIGNLTCHPAVAELYMQM